MLCGVGVHEEEENRAEVGLHESGVRPCLPGPLWGAGRVPAVFQPCLHANAVWPGPHLEKAPPADAEQEEVQEPLSFGTRREDRPAAGSRAAPGP